MDHARVVLGFDRTKSLLLNIALRNHVRRPRMGRRHTWRAHSPLCGVFRKACTTGILHEVGQIGLLAAYPQQYAGLLQTEHDEPADALSSESEWFTFDHCAAGMRSVASGGV
jgi:hypothetical protein